MRLNDEYMALLAKINVKKKAYAEKEMATSLFLAGKERNEEEKIKKNQTRIVVAAAALTVMLGLCFDIFKGNDNEMKIMTVASAAAGVVMLVLFAIDAACKIRLKKTKKEQAKEDEGKKEVRSDIKSLNMQIKALVAGVVLLNEHFYELKDLKENERIKKWEKYVAEFNDAFARKFRGNATYTEYQDYFREYRRLTDGEDE